MAMQTKSNLRVFGYIWSAIFFYLGYHFKKNILLFALGFFFFSTASFFPNLYIKTHIYQLWIKLGNVIGHINSKIIIAILFFFIFTPIALILKLLGKDLLHKKLDKKTTTYLKSRTTQAGSMINQY